MPFSYHLAYFNKKKTAIFDSEKGIENTELAYRIFVDYDDDEDAFEKKILSFFNDEKVNEVKQLIIGMWANEEYCTSDEVIELLTENKEKLSSLEALMIGDITCEETEISWIEQSDINAILVAYPNLKHLQVRGGNGLSLGKVNHDSLEKLVIQTGGLDKKIIHQIGKSTLPNLKHLELWLGEDNYGRNIEVGDIELLYSKELFPNLQYLGLRNSDIADEIAESLPKAEILEIIKELDLSKGTMTDEGAQALLKNDKLKAGNIKVLSVKSNFISSDLCQQLKQNLGIKKVEIKDQKDIEDDWRYVDVGE